MDKKLDPAPDIEAQAQRLGGLLWRLVRTLRAMDSTEQACCGATMSQAHALLSFGDREEMAMSELASGLGLAVSTTTRLVDSLVRGGLAERRRPSDDRRTVLVRLTRAGRERVGTILTNRRQMLSSVLEGIPAERRDEVIAILGQLLAVLISDKPSCCEGG